MIAHPKQGTQHKAAAVNAMAEASARYVKIATGDGAILEIFLGVDDNVVEKAKQKALRSGYTVVENGVKQWISADVVFDHSKRKEGTEAYIWHGDKVAYDRVLKTKDAKGQITEQKLRRVFREW